MSLTPAFRKVLRIVVAAVAVFICGTSAASAATPVKNIVLVHGANTDGSGWRGVHDILIKDGYHVSIVQQPLTGLDDDVAATKRVIDQQKGPVILVGHSYGGTIITVAGADPKVRALVYVAALQPDVGETTKQLAASMPGEMPSSDMKLTSDGFIFVDSTKFAADVAADLQPAQSQYLAHSQMPIAAAAFDVPVKVAAWHDKPSYGIVATADRALNPQLARWMYKRSGAKVTEIAGSHLVYISQPTAVANVIESAARTAQTARTSPTNSSSFSYVIYMRTTPDRVWSALLDPDVQRRIWVDHFLESTWQAGASWRMVGSDGRTANNGEVLEIDPPRRLVLTWRNDIYPERIVEGSSRAVIELQPADGMTKLTVTHTIARTDSKLIDAASGSWPLILSNLKSLLERETAS